MTDLIERLRALADTLEKEVVEPPAIGDPPSPVVRALREAADALARLSPEGDFETTEEERRKWLQFPGYVTASDVPRLIRDLARAKARAGAYEKALRDVLNWGNARCPCENEQPDPCPLCGASVENLEACKSAEKSFPPDLLSKISAALHKEDQP